MTAREQDSSAAAEEAPKVRLLMGGKKYALSYEQAAWLGYKLLETERYEAAEKVFLAISEVHGRDRLMKLFIARCEAGLDHYAACKGVLDDVFGEMAPEVAEKLQSAFVFENLGVLNQAIGRVAEVAKERPDLPAVCLFLGEWLAAGGEQDRALDCWRLAIKRDASKGTVGQMAPRQIRRLLKRGKQKAKTAQEQAGHPGSSTSDRGSQ